MHEILIVTVAALWPHVVLAAVEMHSADAIFSRSTAMGWGLVVAAIIVGGLVPALATMGDDKKSVINRAALMRRSLFGGFAIGMPSALIGRLWFSEIEYLIVAVWFVAIIGGAILQAIVFRSQHFADKAVVSFFDAFIDRGVRIISGRRAGDGGKPMVLDPPAPTGSGDDPMPKATADEAP